MFVEFWMTQMLTRELHDLRKQLMYKQIELSHYQRYASMLGSSSYIALNNIAGLPSYLIPRASLFAQYANNASYMSATQNMQMMIAQGFMPQFSDPQSLSMYQMSAFNNFREEAMKALKQQEANVISEKEKEIELEINDITQKIQMKEAQRDSYKKAAKEQAKDLAPDFG